MKELNHQLRISPIFPLLKTTPHTFKTQIYSRISRTATNLRLRRTPGCVRMVLQNSKTNVSKVTMFLFNTDRSVDLSPFLINLKSCLLISPTLHLLELFLLFFACPKAKMQYRFDLGSIHLPSAQQPNFCRLLVIWNEILVGKAARISSILKAVFPLPKVLSRFVGNRRWNQKREKINNSYPSWPKKPVFNVLLGRCNRGYVTKTSPILKILRRGFECLKRVLRFPSCTTC